MYVAELLRWSWFHWWARQCWSYWFTGSIWSSRSTWFSRCSRSSRNWRQSWWHRTTR